MQVKPRPCSSKTYYLPPVYDKAKIEEGCRALLEAYQYLVELKKEEQNAS